jgi:prepilin-type N-terminal cleavage/methylation domain-containing protein
VTKLRIMNCRLWNLNSEPRTPNPELLVRSKGFTLIEIIVVIVILSIVAAITIKFLADSLRIYTMTVNQKTLLDEGKLALERMCRDIRDARIITTPAAGGSGSTITFLRGNSTAQDFADESITFRLNPTDNTILEKVKSSPSSTSSSIADHVTVFTVTRGATYDEIQIDLKLSLGTGENVTLRTKVYPKNLLQSATDKNFYYCWQEVIS